MFLEMPDRSPRLGTGDTIDLDIAVGDVHQPSLDFQDEIRIRRDRSIGRTGRDLVGPGGACLHRDLARRHKGRRLLRSVVGLRPVLDLWLAVGRPAFRSPDGRRYGVFGREVSRRPRRGDNGWNRHLLHAVVGRLRRIARRVRDDGILMLIGRLAVAAVDCGNSIGAGRGMPAAGAAGVCSLARSI